MLKAEHPSNINKSYGSSLRTADMTHPVQFKSLDFLSDCVSFIKSQSLTSDFW